MVLPGAAQKIGLFSSPWPNQQKTWQFCSEKPKLIHVTVGMG